MTEVANTFADAQASILEREGQKLRVAKAYQELFHGTPTREHQVLVRNDLEAFCGMRSGLMRETFHDTAECVGRFRVWQRIHAFCFPRPTDAVSHGGNHERRNESHRPAPGGGVSEPTTD